MALLELHDLHVHYGNIHALKGISLEVGEGEIVTLIGANGAGKSTTLNAISGLVRASAGSIHYDGQDITRTPAHEIVARGIVQVPEGRRIFARLTVRENLLMGAYLVRDRREIEAGIERVFAMFPRLKEREHQVCGTLSGGEQQMLAIGRALMTRPRVLLMDEPSMGLAPVLVDGIFATIRYLHEEGTTILLVEQNARMALSVADRGYVVETGRIVLADTAAALQANDAVRRAYLGVA
jgi:branched-chain amino acid transport system ATP-binding protein